MNNKPVRKGPHNIRGGGQSRGGGPQRGGQGQGRGGGPQRGGQGQGRGGGQGQGRGSGPQRGKQGGASMRGNLGNAFKPRPIVVRDKNPPQKLAVIQRGNNKRQGGVGKIAQVIQAAMRK